MCPRRDTRVCGTAPPWRGNPPRTDAAFDTVSAGFIRPLTNVDTPMLPPPPRPLRSNRFIVLVLVGLAAFLPEAITGSTPPIAWLNPIQVGLLLWLYGAGVLVCRELAVRWRAGWPGILLLGAAYGIIEEALTVKTMFDPNSPVVGVLGSYGHWAGVNWVWTMWLTIFHPAFSIAFPIFLVEWKWPHVRGRPLLPPWGLHVALCLLAGAPV